MCAAVSSGGKLWDFPAEQGVALYLALKPLKPLAEERSV